MCRVVGRLNQQLLGMGVYCTGTSNNMWELEKEHLNLGPRCLVWTWQLGWLECPVPLRPLYGSLNQKECGGKLALVCLRSVE